MMSPHFALSSEFSGAMAKRLPHAKNQLSMSGSFFNQFFTEIYVYTTTYTTWPKVLEHILVCATICHKWHRWQGNGPIEGNRQNFSGRGGRRDSFY